MIYKLLLFLITTVCCSAATISDQAKQEYGHQLLNAFTFQSEGLSTTAMFHFEQGYDKAIKAGESVKKLEAIRQLFVWYRTYGYYLGLMTKNPNIVGQYSGRTALNSLNAHQRDPELNGKRREYLFGVAEIMSGVLCFWYMPPTQKLTLGAPLVFDGGKRIFNAANYALIQKEKAILELEKRINQLNSVAECNQCPQK